MKTYVYAIAKNEEHFAARWMKSVSEADGVYVLDTGSSDNTVQYLRELGAIVQEEEITPWRFDVARNRSLQFVPENADICVCVDLDEVLSPGWRQELESAWKPTTEEARFTCVRTRLADGTPGTSFLINHAHAGHGFCWKYPVHEVLVRTNECDAWERVDVPNMQADHLPDPQKDRGQYLPLLELAAQEYPDDPRCAHYLGREYMYRERWEDAIRELIRHWNLPTAIWREERAATARYLAECWSNLGDAETALAWALRGIAETPERRESWLEAQWCAYRMGDWEGAAYYGRRCLAITERSSTDVNDWAAWGERPYDMLSIVYWQLGLKNEALEAAQMAAKLAPHNERIQGNVAFLESAVKQQRQKNA